MRLSQIASPTLALGLALSACGGVLRGGYSKQTTTGPALDVFLDGLPCRRVEEADAARERCGTVALDLCGHTVFKEEVELGDRGRYALSGDGPRGHYMLTVRPTALATESVDEKTLRSCQRFEVKLQGKRLGELPVDAGARSILTRRVDEQAAAEAREAAERARVEAASSVDALARAQAARAEEEAAAERETRLANAEKKLLSALTGLNSELEARRQLRGWIERSISARRDCRAVVASETRCRTADGEPVPCSSPLAAIKFKTDGAFDLTVTVENASPLPVACELTVGTQRTDHVVRARSKARLKAVVENFRCSNIGDFGLSLIDKPVRIKCFVPEDERAKVGYIGPAPFVIDADSGQVTFEPGAPNGAQGLVEAIREAGELSGPDVRECLFQEQRGGVCPVERPAAFILQNGLIGSVSCSRVDHLRVRGLLQKSGCTSTSPRTYCCPF